MFLQLYPLQDDLKRLHTFNVSPCCDWTQRDFSAPPVPFGLLGGVILKISGEEQFPRIKTPFLVEASLCSVRIVRKVPDLKENFMGLAVSLLKVKHHGDVDNCQNIMYLYMRCLWKLHTIHGSGT